MNEKQTVFERHGLGYYCAYQGEIGYFVYSKETCMECVFYSVGCPIDCRSYLCYGINGSRIGYFKKNLNYDSSYLARTIGKKTVWLSEESRLYNKDNL